MFKPYPIHKIQISKRCLHLKLLKPEEGNCKGVCRKLGGGRVGWASVSNASTLIKVAGLVKTSLRIEYPYSMVSPTQANISGLVSLNRYLVTWVCIPGSEENTPGLGNILGM